MKLNSAAVSVADQEKAALEGLQENFDSFASNNSNYALTFWMDSPVSAWGATTIKYTYTNNGSLPNAVNTIIIPFTCTFKAGGTFVITVPKQ